ncbi:phosphate ABC transporter permease PstA [Candidatus Bipolaricaulota bacterium]|nr:phosphate ABC transporter permease PstA [Candidatus Bipolaricaulota bacterium]
MSPVDENISETSVVDKLFVSVEGKLMRRLMLALWLVMGMVFLAISTLTAIWPNFLSNVVISTLGAFLLVAVGLTIVAFKLLKEYQPPMIHFLLSLFLIAFSGVVFLFFPNHGLEIPALEGDVTPQLATISLFFIVTFATVWTGLLFYWENPAHNRQLAVQYFTWVSVAIPLGVLTFFIVYTIMEGSSVITWDFISSASDLMRGEIGIFPAIMGTFSLIIGATVFAVPLGVGAAIFLTEYAKRGWIKQAVGVTADCLWSTPSIVFGLFGYVFLVPRITGHSTLLAGQIILAAMLLPLTIATSTEAITAVPDEFRNGSLALGASKWWTIRRVVLPSSVPSIVTGVLLGVGRIAGETAPIMLIAVASHTNAPNFFSLSPPYFHLGPLFSEVDALPYRLYSIYKAGVGGSIHEAWGTAMVLIALVLMFYGLGISIRSYYRRNRGW